MFRSQWRQNRPSPEFGRILFPKLQHGPPSFAQLPLTADAIIVVKGHKDVAELLRQHGGHEKTVQGAFSYLLCSTINLKNCEAQKRLSSWKARSVA